MPSILPVVVPLVAAATAAMAAPLSADGAGAGSGAATAATSAPTATSDARPDAIPPNLLRPIPSSGGVPLMVAADGPGAGIFAPRSGSRDEERALRALVHRHFRSQRPDVRRAGFDELRTYTDPATFRPMIDVLSREAADVRCAMLDHFAESGEAGQAALAYTAITGADAELRHAATERLRRPASDAVLRVIDQALRETRHDVVNHAGRLAGNLNVTAAIPAMIFAQVADDPVEETGDMAWIAVGTTKSYVANVIPIVGDNSGAYAPVIDQVFEGVVFRVQNAVAYAYRGDLHQSLVAMSSADFGEGTEWLGYDMRGWWTWFNERYVPFKQRQAEELAQLERIERIREAQSKAPSAPPPPPEPPAPREPE